MNRFIIVDGLPYLLSHENVFAVRLNEIGFDVGKQVEFSEIPPVTYSELSIRAKCKVLSSIMEEQEIESAEKKKTEKAEKRSKAKTGREY